MAEQEFVGEITNKPAPDIVPDDETIMERYLTYSEYKELGGALDETAFNRVIVRVEGIVKNATHRRIEQMKSIPQGVKALCRDLVDYLINNSDTEKTVASKSQSAGSVSESESYTAKSREQISAEIENIICDYLICESDDNGTPLLYRGCSV